MSALSGIAGQLGLDHTFFFQFALFAVLFLFMGPLYFNPFLALIELRQSRTTQDREAARKIAAQAEERLRSYREKIQAGRQGAQASYDEVVIQAHQQEAVLINAARAEAKKIMQSALDSVARQKDAIKAQLEADVVGIAKTIADRMLAGRG